MNIVDLRSAVGVVRLFLRIIRKNSLHLAKHT
jgi:hypothetical protein